MDKKKELLVQFSQLDEMSLEYMKQHMESYSEESFEQHLFQMAESEAPVVEEVVEVEEIIEEVVTEETVEEVVEEEPVVEFDYKSAYEQIKGEFDAISEQFTAVQEELTSLREFKNNSLKEEKLELIGNFSDLKEEILKGYIENVDKFSKEELETKLFAEVGKKNLEFSKNKKQKKTDENLVVFTNLETGGSDSNAPTWAQLVEQFKLKNK
jgi:hypothetical protein